MIIEPERVIISSGRASYGVLSLFRRGCRTRTVSPTCRSVRDVTTWFPEGFFASLTQTSHRKEAQEMLGVRKETESSQSDTVTDDGSDKTVSPSSDDESPDKPRRKRRKSNDDGLTDHPTAGQTTPDHRHWTPIHMEAAGKHTTGKYLTPGKIPSSSPDVVSKVLISMIIKTVE